MLTLSEISERLGSLQFRGFESVVREFLTCFEIPDSSVSRIVSRVSEDKSKPTFVFRKAVLFCMVDLSASIFEEMCREYEHDFPLVLAFGSEGLHYCTPDGKRHFSSYGNLYKCAEDFLPLILSERNKKDTYRTLDFGSTVASLYRSLMEDNNSDSSCVDVLFDILNIVLFGSYTSRSEIESILGNPNHGYQEKVDALYWRFKCYRKSGKSLHVSKGTFAYIEALVHFDKSLLDIEVLTSLIYKIFGDDDALLYGLQTSFVNVRKVLNSLFVDEYRERILVAPDEELESIAKSLLSKTFIDPTNSPGCFLASAFSAVSDMLMEIDQRLGTSYAGKLQISRFVALVDNRIASMLSELTLTYCAFVQGEEKSMSIVKGIQEDLKVVLSNPLTEDWLAYTDDVDNTIIFGSPRFLGYTKLSSTQKRIVNTVYGKSVSGVDYSSAWLVKAAGIVGHSDALAAFVLTNSVVQGSQVAEIWPKIYSLEAEVRFAYSSFKWKTNERTNIGVSVVIIGLGCASDKTKYLYQENQVTAHQLIGPYLVPDTDIIVRESRVPISALPVIRKGNMPYDQGHLLLDTKQQYEDFVSSAAGVKKFIKRIVGSDEFIKNIRRWCIWIPDEASRKEALQYDAIRQRVNKVREFRATSTATERCKNTPYQFREIYATSKGQVSLVIPSVSSEKRQYVPMGFINDKVIVSNLAFAVYDCEPWLMGIITSRMHMQWMKLVCGALETRYRYSNVLCYNTFPMPELSDTDKFFLKMYVFQLISLRERYCDMSLGQLYNEMPLELEAIHSKLDEFVDSLYRETPFGNDFERSQYLIQLYQKSLNHG